MMKLALLCVALSLAVGCGGGTADLSSQGDASAPEREAAGESDIDASTSAEREDYEEVTSCQSASPCGAARVFNAEGTMLHDGDPACIVAALGQRTPARYQFAIDDYTSSHGSRADLVVVVNADGSVEIAVRDSLSANVSSGEPFRREDYRATQRCVLKPAEFFSACAAALADEIPSYECAFDRIGAMQPQKLPPWFVSCADVAPTCTAP